MDADIVILGGGLAGMCAAYEATQHGLRPVVVETRGRPGGLIASARLEGVAFDIGAESWATRSSVVGELVDELGLNVTNPTGRSWVWNTTLGKAYPIPDGTLGLPADIDAPEVLEAIGEDGVQRAKEDLQMGSDVAADAKDLATLIETRVGSAVLDHLVRPVAGGIHTSDPADLAADTVTPGLRQTMIQTGSLLKAATVLSNRHPGPKVAQTEGGMFRLIEALEEAVVTKGGQVLTRHSGVNFACLEDGRWQVSIQPTVRPDNPADEPMAQGPVQTLTTKRLVVALPGTLAMAMLGERLDLPTWHLPVGAPIAHQVLMIDSAELDDGPRGSGLLVSAPQNSAGAAVAVDDVAGGAGSDAGNDAGSEAGSDAGSEAGSDAGSDAGNDAGSEAGNDAGSEAGSDAGSDAGNDAPRAIPEGSASSEVAATPKVAAKALSHLSYKWGWMKDVLPPSRHILRVSYGRPGEPYPQPTLESALDDVNTLLGTHIQADDVVAHMLVRWDGQLAPQTPQHRAHVAQFLQAVDRYPGLKVTGAWVAGSGFAAVVPHARKVVRELATDGWDAPSTERSDNCEFAHPSDASTSRLSDNNTSQTNQPADKTSQTDRPTDSGSNESAAE